MNTFYKKICFILGIVLAIPHAAIATPDNAGTASKFGLLTMCACALPVLAGAFYYFYGRTASNGIVQPANAPLPQQPVTPQNHPFFAPASKYWAYQRYLDFLWAQKKENRLLAVAAQPISGFKRQNKGMSKSDMIKKIIELSPKQVNAPDDDGNSPLAWAVIAEAPSQGLEAVELVKVLQVLIDAKADINYKAQALAQLKICLNDKRKKTILGILLILKADINQTNEHGETLLHRAIQKDPFLSKLLIDIKADINIMSGSGFMPLHFAAETGQTDVIRHLLNARADIHACGLDGRTALMWASQSNRINATRSLITHKALLNVQNDRDDYNSALHYAINNGSSDCVRVLSRAGASVDTRTKMGISPLRQVFLSTRPNVYHMKSTLLALLQEKAVTPEEVQQEAANVVSKKGEDAIDLETQEEIRFNPLHANEKAVPFIKESVRQALDEYYKEHAKSAAEFDEVDAS